MLISKNISCHDEKHITHDILLEILFFLLPENAKEEWCNLQIFQASAVLRSLSKIQYKWSSSGDISTCLKTIDACYFVLCLPSLSLYCDVIWLFNPNKTLNLKSRLPGIMLRKWKTKQGLWNIRCLCEPNELFSFDCDYRYKTHYLTSHCSFLFERNCILYVLQTLTHNLYILETMTWTRSHFCPCIVPHICLVFQRSSGTATGNISLINCLFEDGKRLCTNLEAKGATQPSQTC